MVGTRGLVYPVYSNSKVLSMKLLESVLTSIGFAFITPKNGTTCTKNLQTMTCRNSSTNTFLGRIMAGKRHQLSDTAFLVTMYHVSLTDLTWPTLHLRLNTRLSMFHVRVALYKHPQKGITARLNISLTRGMMTAHTSRINSPVIPN